MSTTSIINYQRLSEQDKGIIRQLCEKMGASSNVMGILSQGQWTFKRVANRDNAKYQRRGWLNVGKYTA